MLLQLLLFSVKIVLNISNSTKVSRVIKVLINSCELRLLMAPVVSLICSEVTCFYSAF